MFRRPTLQILNAGGLDILPRLSGVWQSCTVREAAGGESDSAEIVCARKPGFAPPTKGATFTVLGGWADEGPVLQGVYTAQTIACSGDAGSGESIRIALRAADYVDKLKAHGAKHWDDSTFGQIVEDMARKAGLSAQVDPALAKIAIPYRLWRDQSIIDFLTELADELGATVKPAGGKLIAVKRGAGQSASGKALTPILIRKTASYGYEIEIEPRPDVGEVAASWHDPKQGKRKVEKHETGRSGPRATLRHPFIGEDAARAGAEALAYEMGANTGTGHFDSPGLPLAHAEAPVIATGFGAPIDGLWTAESIEKVWDAEGGFSTTVTVSAGKEPKG